MKLYLNSESYIETDFPIDISIPLISDESNLRAWYVDAPIMEPVRANGFIGSVNEGGSVNFRSIYFNPHGHGTHTECLGHITPQIHSINQTLKKFMFKAQLVTLEPNKVDEDLLIFASQLDSIEWYDDIQALIVRTVPNDSTKKHINYSDTNPTYFEEACVDVLNQHQIIHFIVDLPSVDKEKDNGELAFHHKFWGVPNKPDFNRTITELAYIDDEVEDGLYILNLQVAPFENDASPSRPVLFKIRANHSN